MYKNPVAAPEPLLTLEEAAARTGTTPRLIRRLVERRELPSVKVGRYVRIAPRDLESYIAAQTRPAR